MPTPPFPEENPLLGGSPLGNKGSLFPGKKEPPSEQKKPTPQVEEGAWKGKSYVESTIFSKVLKNADGSYSSIINQLSSTERQILNRFSLQEKEEIGQIFASGFLGGIISKDNLLDREKINRITKALKGEWVFLEDEKSREIVKKLEEKYDPETRKTLGKILEKMFP